ncbi:alanine dehydrogenase [Kribbella catacumbae]|uniref:alanine dehydrogenase n=1 Tax=Kribbella catacumbae TaxID=460086 RepID=UPI00047780D2|nr:alanine dehydrogenase [Kribbella catacumbae]
MRIGVPKEIKNHEYRVAITPTGVDELTRRGHEVYVETAAGLGSSITDAEYLAAGAKVLDSADEVWAAGDLLLKVKEPIEPEYGRMRAGQVLFTYLHLAASRPCTEALLDRSVTAIAYETVQLPSGALPLLAPMSEVAGRLAPQAGAHHLKGSKAPRLISNDLVARMKPGSVLVDIAIDQGGCFEDSRPTTHAEPTFTVHNSVLYCVANMPGAVANTSTYALTNVTLPYVAALADHGWREALRGDRALAGGLSTYAGQVTHRPVAEAHGMACADLEPVG